MNGENPRQIAVRVLRQRDASERIYRKSAGKRPWPRRALSPADRGLCQELVYGIVRWQATLDWLIARKTDGRAAKARACKICCAWAFIRFSGCDRIPPHAAVHETVELAKQLGLRPASRFHQRRPARLSCAKRTRPKRLLAELKTSQPALGFSHPEWLVERWQKHFGDEKTRAIARMEQHAAKNLCPVNTLKDRCRGKTRC